MQAADKAADLFLGGGGGTPFLGAAGIRFQIATGAEGFEQERGEALEIGGSGGDVLLSRRDGLRIAREFIETDGHGLPEVHGAMFFSGGDAEEPMAVAEVFIRKTTFLRAKKKSDAAAREMFAEETGGLIEAANRVLGLAATDGSRSDDERAVRDGFSDGLEFFGAGEQRCGADGGSRLTKSQLIGIHHAKMGDAEVAHGAGGRADVEGVARGDENDAQVVEFGLGRQQRRVYSR